MTMWRCRSGWRARRDGDYAHDVKELLSWVGLGDRMQARPPTLSGGEQQRVAIARAVVARPDLLIADEPTGNVDPEMGARLIRLFGELNRLGTTVLIATHDRDLIEATRAREMRLVDGKLVELRSARECRLMREIHAVLPRDKGAAPLDFVIAVMAFLAALALGASLIADRATRRLEPRPCRQAHGADRAAGQWRRQSRFWTAKPTRRSICCAPRRASPMPRCLSDAELDALVAPWVGKNGLTSDIPAAAPDRRLDHAGREVDVAGAGRAIETGRAPRHCWTITAAGSRGSAPSPTRCAIPPTEFCC